MTGERVIFPLSALDTTRLAHVYSRKLIVFPVGGPMPEIAPEDIVVRVDTVREAESAPTDSEVPR